MVCFGDKNAAACKCHLRSKTSNGAIMSTLPRQAEALRGVNNMRCVS